MSGSQQLLPSTFPMSFPDSFQAVSVWLQAVKQKEFISFVSLIVNFAPND